MIEYICDECKGLQYSSTTHLEKTVCIYCHKPAVRMVGDPTTERVLSVLSEETSNKEYKRLKFRDTPMKPKASPRGPNEHKICPVCFRNIYRYSDEFCSNCGQHFERSNDIERVTAESGS